LRSNSHRGKEYRDAGVDGAEVVKILRSRRESEKLRRLGSRLDAEKAVERDFCDAVLQVTGSS
jgi:hypothetical protein